MRAVLLALLTLALTGCAATGPGIEPQQVTALQKGRTTFDDVVRQFGRPSLNSKNMDDTRTAIYLQPGNDEPGAVVSLVTAIAGIPTANRDSVTFEFDTKDVLTDYRWRQSNPAAVAAPAAPPAAPATGAPSTSAGSAQSTQAVAAKPANSGTTSAPPRPSPAPAKKRDDGLPGWLPSGNYDPRDPFK